MTAALVRKTPVILWILVFSGVLISCDDAVEWSAGTHGFQAHGLLRYGLAMHGRIVTTRFPCSNCFV